MSLKIVFMGSPDFAVPALKSLIESEHDVVAVYTQPARKANRGKKECGTPVCSLANDHNIPTFMPESLKSEEAQKEFADIEADIAVVAAYGLLLPKAVLEAYKYGCINIHPSLLPRWRGAAPLHRTIMAGDEETGVCIMQMDEGLDTGDVITMETFDIPKGFTTGDLHEEMAQLGAKLTLETLEKIEQGLATYTPQSEEGVEYAKKISKDEARIDWTQPAEEICKQIRSLNPYPSAHFVHDGARIRIHKAKVTNKAGKPGEVVDHLLTVACGEGSISPVYVQKEGKNTTDTVSFLCGHPIEIGTCLDTK